MVTYALLLITYNQEKIAISGISDNPREEKPLWVDVIRPALALHIGPLLPL
jgi:hypothetical protein